MNPTTELIFTLAGAALTLLTIYGALKLDSKLFLYGVCLFSILPLIGETTAYSADKAPLHIMVIFIYLAQFVLAFPNKIVYGADNAAATKLSTKIALAILLFNIGGAILILCLTTSIPAQFGYYHVAIAFAVVYLIGKRISSNGLSWVK